MALYVSKVPCPGCADCGRGDGYETDFCHGTGTVELALCPSDFENDDPDLVARVNGLSRDDLARLEIEIAEDWNAELGQFEPADLVECHRCEGEGRRFDIEYGWMQCDECEGNRRLHRKHIEAERAMVLQLDAMVRGAA